MKCPLAEKGCGGCRELPCGRYEAGDPTKTPEENAEDHRKQLEQLGLMR